MKKGFTLVELLAIFIILGVLLMIIVPIVNSTINESRQELYNEQIEKLLEHSRTYATSYELGYENNNYKALTFDELINSGLITEVPKNPINGEDLEGCIVYAWKDNIKQYEFKYEEECNVLDDNEAYINLMESGAEFQSKIGSYRDTITEVNFYSSFSGKYDTASIKWDFSENDDMKVLGYIEEVDGRQVLNIEANDVIIAHEQMGGNCSYSTKKSMFCYFSKVEAINFNDVVDTSNVANMSYLFSKTSKLKILDLNDFDTSSVTNMQYMFFSASSLTYINLNSFDTSNVTSMSYMFSGNIKLTNLGVNHFNTSKVTSMSGMFENIPYLENLDVSNFDTSNVTRMYQMFSGLENLTNLNLENFNTSKVTDMAYMFSGNRLLQELNISNFDTSKVNDMSYMFEANRSMTKLDLSHFNTSKVYEMAYMFSNMELLNELDISNFNTESVGNMKYMFEATGLKTLDLDHFYTYSLTVTEGMFFSSAFLTDIKISNLNVSGVAEMNYMFSNIDSLVTLDISEFSFHMAEEFDGFLEYSYNLETVYVFSQEEVDLLQGLSGTPSGIQFIPN